MKSSTGRTMALARRLRAAQMPDRDADGDGDDGGDDDERQGLHGLDPQAHRLDQQERHQGEQPEAPLALEQRERDEHEGDDERAAGR